MSRVSEIQAKRGAVDAFETPYTDFAHECNTPVCSLFHAGGLHEVSTVNHVKNGAGSTDNIFTITDNVYILELYGVCIAVSDATTFGAFKFEIDDGAAQANLSTGVGAAGIVVGGMLTLQDDPTNPTIFSNPTAATVITASSKRIFEPSVVMQKTGGVTTYIRANYTGDAATDITIKYHFRWAPIMDTSNVEAV